LTSKIINMAEKLMDAEDRMLESIFRSEPIADGGFSRRLVARIRRRIWVRRLALPIAMLIGTAIAIKPASQLFIAASKLLTVIPQQIVNAPAELLPTVESAIVGGPILPILVYGIVLLVIALIGSLKLVE
jgi:hypothetical protein